MRASKLWKKNQPADFQKQDYFFWPKFKLSDVSTVKHKILKINAHATFDDVWLQKRGIE